MSFDLKKNWLDSDLAESIIYNGEPINAVVYRKELGSFSIQGLNNQVPIYTIKIEVSAEDVPAPLVGKAAGHAVTLKNMRGQIETLRVAEIIKFDPYSNSFLLGLS